MSDKPEDAGHGTLFRNDRREKPSHPEFTGQCEIYGQKYRLAAWVKQGKTARNSSRLPSVMSTRRSPNSAPLSLAWLATRSPSDALAVLENSATTAWPTRR